MPVQASAGHFHSEELEFDPEWLAILSRTHTLLQTHRGDVRLPQQVDKISAQVFYGYVSYISAVCNYFFWCQQLAFIHAIVQ